MFIGNCPDGKPETRMHSDPQCVILVVDDEPDMRDILTRVLQKEGYFVLTAEDGEEALIVSRRFVGTIHILLSDVIMPKLDGLELRRHILAERPDTKVLLMSADSRLKFDES